MSELQFNLKILERQLHHNELVKDVNSEVDSELGHEIYDEMNYVSDKIEYKNLETQNELILELKIVHLDII